MKISCSFKSIFLNYDPLSIIGDFKSFYNLKTKRIEKLFLSKTKDPKNYRLLNEKFYPSFTAQNNLNFLIKDQINLVLKEKFINEEILDLYRIIYILIREKFNEITTENLIPNLIYNIIPKFNIEGLSKFIFFII